MAQAVAPELWWAGLLTLSVLAVTAGWREGPRVEISPFVAEQIAGLREAGCRVQLGAVEDRLSLPSMARCVQAFRSKVRQQRIDLVHAHYGSVISLVGLASGTGAAYVVSFGGSDLLGVPVSSPYWWARQNLSLGFSLASALAADAVIVKSANLLDALPRWAARKAVVLPNGVNLGKFSPADRLECRRRLGWEPDAPTVLFNGGRDSSVFVKNAPLAYQAVERARLTLANVRLVVTGNDPPDSIPVMLNAADCLLVTSLHEGSPNIIKEAMACDLPIVSVPCGDVTQRLTTPQVGQVCPFDARALGDALVDYLRAGSRSHGRSALRAQGLDSASVAESMLALFRQVMEARL